MLEKVREGWRRLEKVRKESWKRRLEKVRESWRKLEKVRESLGICGNGSRADRAHTHTPGSFLMVSFLTVSFILVKNFKAS